MSQQENMVFCTLFDSNYLDKGLALYHSMKKNIRVFKLYIFAFDNRCYEILSTMRLKNVILLSLEDIMSERLQQIQYERTWAEFCWTCTPLIVEHVLLMRGEKICTYVDADIYFFSSPVSAIQETINGGCSVGLVEHRFERNSGYGEHLFSVGKYCIQFNTFLNDKKGIKVLEDWKENCLDWCFCRCEDGKFGDQKYPDKWKQKYSCIHESRNLGVGVAPWNLHLYSYIGRRNGDIWLGYRGRPIKLVFYHFEGIRYFKDGSVYLNLWEPYVSGMRRTAWTLYGEYFGTIGTIRKFLDEVYGVTFRHMAIERKSFCGKNDSLKYFCMENGVLEGGRKWIGYWANNIVSIGKLSKK